MRESELSAGEPEADACSPLHHCHRPYSAVLMTYRVFVSYSSRDLATAAQVKQWLTVAGVQVFLAEYSLAAGADLGEAILREIRTCDMFVLLWSTGAKESDWVPQEVGVARGQGKLIVPVLLEHGMKLPAFLAGLKYLPAFKDLGQALEWLRQNVADKARQKSHANAWLGVGGALLLLAALSKEGADE